MDLLVSYKCVWGKHLFYPVNDDAKRLAKLIGCRALSRRNLKIIREFGWTLRIEIPNIEIEKVVNE
jgi:hypothetical protein